MPNVGGVYRSNAHTTWFRVHDPSTSIFHVMEGDVLIVTDVQPTQYEHSSYVTAVSSTGVLIQRSVLKLSWVNWFEEV